MQGQLFSQDFLTRAVGLTPPWQDASESWLDEQISKLQTLLTTAMPQGFAQATWQGDGQGPHNGLNEAQTEELVIKPILQLLDWQDCYLTQVNLSARRREDVPDMLLFANQQQRQQGLSVSTDEQRVKFGICLLEAKRWGRPLDRGESPQAAELGVDMGAPSSQMLRYLSRADVVSEGRLKWGILTNGGTWRLYWQNARSRAEEFFEVNLISLLSAIHESAVNALPPDLASEREWEQENGLTARHGLKLFFLLFARQAFLPQDWEGAAGQSFHILLMDRDVRLLYE